MTNKMQKTENVAKGNFNAFSEFVKSKTILHEEDLTTQYKNKQLEWFREYYVDLEDSGYITKLYLNDDWRFYDGLVARSLKDHPYMKVLEIVPNYEELQNMDKVINQAMAINIKLIEENAELKQRLKDTQNANAELNKTIQHLSKTQARQFVDNQNLQVKAEKAKDVIDLDAARQIKQLKAKNDDFKKIIEYMIDELVDPNDDVSLGLAEYFSQDLINEIYEVLK